MKRSRPYFRSAKPTPSRRSRRADAAESDAQAAAQHARTLDLQEKRAAAIAAANKAVGKPAARDEGSQS